MSLTSYRAAPPRDKPLRALSKNRMPKRLWPTPRAPIDPVRRLPEKATRAMPLGRNRYVPTRARFGKARERSFRDFMPPKPAIVAQTGPPAPSCQKLRKSPALEQREALRKHHGPVTEEPGAAPWMTSFTPCSSYRGRRRRRRFPISIRAMASGSHGWKRCSDSCRNVLIQSDGLSRDNDKHLGGCA
jgi:hypothetical protein